MQQYGVPAQKGRHHGVVGPQSSSQPQRLELVVIGWRHHLLATRPRNACDDHLILPDHKRSDTAKRQVGIYTDRNSYLPGEIARFFCSAHAKAAAGAKATIKIIASGISPTIVFEKTHLQQAAAGLSSPLSGQCRCQMAYGARAISESPSAAWTEMGMLLRSRTLLRTELLMRLVQRSIGVGDQK
jgi:hypothetical protein